MELTTEVLARVKHYVNFYGMKFHVREPIEDIFQDVVLSLIETKYLERYDASRPLHNYLSGFIYNFFCKVYKVENYAVNKAISIFKTIPDAEELTICDSMVSQTQDPTFDYMLDSVCKDLDERFPYYTYIVYDSDFSKVGEFSKDKPFKGDMNNGFVMLCRDASTVLRFLAYGFTRTEISSLLSVSKSWTSKMLVRIYESPEIQELAQDKGFASTMSNYSSEE